MASREEARSDRQEDMIFTIGHSNVPIEAFVAALRRHGVARVVDVRSTPYSQWTPWFNRAELERTLPAAAIAYAFAGEYLGGRPSDPACYHAGVVPAGEADYLALVDYEAVARTASYQRGLERLVAVAAEQPTAIMCSEEDPRRCHRHHLIAQSLLGRGLAVGHIRKDGTVEPAAVEPKQLTLLP